MNIEFNEDQHSYTLDGTPVPSVTTVLSSVGISDFSMVDDETLTRAVNYGQSVHNMTQLHDEGRLDESTLDPKLKVTLDLWREFKSKYISEWIGIEMRVASKKYGYAGTMDRVAVSKDNELWLPDIKTGVKTIAHPIQTAAYENAFREMTGEKKRINRMTIYLNTKIKVEFYGKTSHEFKRDFNLFRCALTVHKFKTKGA